MSTESDPEVEAAVAAASIAEGRTPAEEAVEVLFTNDGVRRRRSSMVPDEYPDHRRKQHSHTHHHRPEHGRRLTSCYVHSMLEEHRGSGTYTPREGAEKTSDKDPLGKTTNGAEVQHTESRLLTKKQLSDMAFGIRELSKKLSHVKLKLNVRNIFILTKAHDETLVVHTRELAEWLLKRDAHYTVWVEDKLEHDPKFNAKELLTEGGEKFEDRLKYWNNELCRKRPNTFDIVLGLGGDGTVLYASWLFQRIVPPVLAFSMGSLGFLTKFDFDHYPDTITRAACDGVTVALRLRFEGTIMRRNVREGDENRSRDLVEELIGEEAEDHHTHRPDGTHNVMNEVVIDRGPNPTMSTLEVFGDNQHFTTIQADGIVVATPTGSTAYNLAAGGSLCHPENPVILLTAICAHTLSFRPIILPDTMVLRVGVPFDARTSSWASFDGRERVELHPGDYVTISASRYPFPSVLPLERKKEDWIDSISRTLQWNSRQRQKKFDER
ncbi:uncharacterized protein PV09_05052 [Verruconis gallopava]|uniref:NAD+ kinase n=1 Tax=Verruconis gallopava TaxID=253628 RepID=A0A0D2AAV9_9PEZI|nr:uncharacterized protein PV09_05052 [Verruconis gallopava]KIW03745.1 hypothetical protein PV09_05052 [Verruconis gallopava]